MAKKEPAPITDGNWWTAGKAAWVKCDRCYRLHKARATVMRYVRGQDLFADQGTKYQGWPERGWLLWGYCPKAHRDYLQVVDETDVRRWDTIAGALWKRQGTGGGKGYLPR